MMMHNLSFTNEGFVLMYIFLIFINFHFIHCKFVHVQSFEGEVGAENFTYYKLVLEGHVLVQLQTIKGDADLYLSTDTLQPTWMDYTLKSDTCSHDVVVVDKYLDRPVGIGVYGYVHYPKSKYLLSVHVDSSKHHYYPENNPIVKKSAEKLKTTNTKASSVIEKDEEESMVWTVFVGFLQFVLEVLL